MPDDIHPLSVGTILRAADGSDQYKVILGYDHDDVGYTYRHAEIGGGYRKLHEKNNYTDSDFDRLLEGEPGLVEYRIAFQPDE